MAPHNVQDLLADGLDKLAAASGVVVGEGVDVAVDALVGSLNLL